MSRRTVNSYFLQRMVDGQWVRADTASDPEGKQAYDLLIQQARTQPFITPVTLSHTWRLWNRTDVPVEGKV